MLTPIVSFFIGLHKQNELKQDQSSQPKLWGSLFYEFKEDAKAAQSQFYTIYFIRRFLYIVVIFTLIDYPTIQLAICLVLVLSVTIYSDVFLYYIL